MEGGDEVGKVRWRGKSKLDDRDLKKRDRKRGRREKGHISDSERLGPETALVLKQLNPALHKWEERERGQSKGRSNKARRTESLISFTTVVACSPC